MRKVLLSIIVVLLIGGAIGLIMKQDPGYVMISFKAVTIEMSLWVMLLFVALGYAAIMITLRVIWILMHPNSSLSKLTGTMSHKRALKSTIKGMLELAGGNWGKAEKLLTTSANKVSYPLLNYIGAAYAASEQEEHERSKELLRKAHQTSPDAEFAISFVQSQLQLKQGHYEGALATLKRLHDMKPKHRQTLKMLVTAYTQLKDWEALQELTPALKKHGIYNEANLLELEKNSFVALLEKLRFREKTGLSKEVLLDELQGIWKKLDGLAKDEEMQALYAATLIEFGSEAKAEAFIRTALNDHWSDTLAGVYGQLTEVSLQKSLGNVETWIRRHPDSAPLYLSAGRICQRLQLWGKARDYYEKALRLDSSSEAIVELSLLLESMGDLDEAQDLIIKRIRHDSKSVKALPLPH
ncbi:heme biosynthesis HemY N-terminal domain-containing protein [Marinomonas fungiae]|uniref:Heme biosynthesis-associated TPR protein n=1 Tax=Marinomonas fungiae TaxID=1137284 RepID=A0A0K6IJ28_9GAMM|nr:heme biosynthesis HemY N-terminal domain-containing protein [Marinomonas fungiae]CUB03098.1 heme biosynthesis-associated TPR protein [Marinomonas fungiae]